MKAEIEKTFNKIPDTAMMRICWPFGTECLQGNCKECEHSSTNIRVLAVAEHAAKINWEAHFNYGLKHGWSHFIR